MKETTDRRYVSDYRRRFGEPAHRLIRRTNLDRLGNMVVDSMSVAGDTPLPAEWRPMIKQINQAYQQDPHHVMVLLWRLLADFSLKMAKGRGETKSRSET
jgi:hypothetical protein